MTVADLEAALKFWEAFLGKPARWTTVLDRPYLGRIVGYPGIAINAAFVDLPGGDRSNCSITRSVKRCQHRRDRQSRQRPSLPQGRRRRRRLAAGGRLRRAADLADGPVAIDGGPNIGAQAAYLRIHDGITLELFQPPPKGNCMIKRISFLRRKEGHEQGGVLRTLDRTACRHRAADARRAWPALRPGAELESRGSRWDGVGEFWFDSVEAALKAFATEPFA